MTTEPTVTGARKPKAIPKRIALVAHDNCKQDLTEWVRWNHELLVQHQLICTGNTGKLVKSLFGTFRQEEPTSREPDVIVLKSGPLGGDQQLGAMIAEGRIDIVIFFWDPLEPHPHDVDVKALLRIAVVYNVPIACNRSTADFLISSPLMEEEYQPKKRDFAGDPTRKV
ncbi:MAG: methylglyoxal synthase [Pseudomonadota bacterium]